jgi:uncharacterized protein (TIGR00730 family)
MASVCVFCGSRSGDRPEYVKIAQELGEFLSANGHTLIYGGGSTGMMGAIADAMLNSKGRIVGVIPTHLARVELMHHAVTDMRLTVDMHERKATMHRISDVYVALPGGFGTMEELFEAVTWAQLDLHQRPIVIVNVHGIFDGLVQLMDTMMSSGFLSAKCRSLVTVVNNMDTLQVWLEQHVSTTMIP